MKRALTKQLTISIRAKPNASKSELVDNLDGSFTCFVRAPAEDGKANAEICEVVASAYGVKQRDVVVKTAKGRNKVVVISNVTIAEGDGDG
jgi:uncharacterized protein (TIGR00251 family)